jgi:membrane protein
LFLLHLVVIAGWLFTLALDDRLRRGGPAPEGAPAAPGPDLKPAAAPRR